MPDIALVPCEPANYLAGHVMLARAWRPNASPDALTWLYAALRGELPPPRQPPKNWHYTHVTLPRETYLLALAALSDLDKKCMTKAAAQ